MREGFTIFDAGVYALVLVTALLLLLFGAGGAAEEGAFAVVTCGGSSARYSLDSDMRESIVSEGHTLTLVIENGGIRVEDADCPDRICEKTGVRSRAGDFICCVPAGVYIKIEGGEADADFISG